MLGFEYNSCISGDHRQSSKSNTIIVGMYGSSFSTPASVGEEKLLVLLDRIFDRFLTVVVKALTLEE